VITIPTSETAERPKGSPFLIDRCPFHYGEQISYATLDLAEDKVFNWPMVYILANEDTAYVGQTTSVVTRMGQHGANEEKRDFETVNIIYNDEFNASVITDYEHRLIGYMHADGRYTLTNKNDGMTDTNYFSKAEYEDMFGELWEDLRGLDLAEHSISEIEESEVFKYSPFKGLTIDQRSALDKILCAIDTGLENAEPIVVEGMPGTGKTVLATYLLKTLRDNPRYAGMNVRVVEPVTSLKKTLQKSLANVSGLNSSDIIGPMDLVKPSMGYKADGEKSFDILLVDEAHKLKRRTNLGTQFGNYDDVNRELGLPKQATQMDWIIDQAKLPIFFYDPLQSIGPSCLGSDAVKSTLGKAVESPIELESQMRVKGGKVYLEYIQEILDGECSSHRHFEGYDLLLHEDFGSFVDSFEKDYEVHDLSRMVAGYAWKWVSKKDRDALDIVIDDIGLRWNCTYDNWVGRGINDPQVAHEVGCIHSIQGYDLSYAYVIIGNDLMIDAKSGIPISNRASYYDRNGYATASDKDLDRYIKNIYYVLLTRGILGTHVYVEDPTLRAYFAKYFPTV
jgi:DUF2075 family protein